MSIEMIRSHNLITSHAVRFNEELLTVAQTVPIKKGCLFITDYPDAVLVAIAIPHETPAEIGYMLYGGRDAEYCTMTLSFQGIGSEYNMKVTYVPYNSVITVNWIHILAVTTIQRTPSDQCGHMICQGKAPNVAMWRGSESYRRNSVGKDERI
ncbi:hypothetical protein B0H17DRAFT_1153142 [Mycena rosella]|uniref:Uncharacterized protein n=1 Tax=Mycena rosella TaxID=1033263 RepID=A0AAD7B880_MYCRO|nr:hypothetical protein B0H17DRAFT_1153142 [Mycena rosella]